MSNRQTSQIVAVLLFAGSASGAQPPPTPGDLAGCETSNFVVDAMVCSDQRLKQADVRVRALATTLDPTIDGVLIEKQQAWFNRCNRCAMQRDRARCLHDAYEERIAVLTAIGTQRSAQRLVTCTPPSEIAGATSIEGGVVLSREDGTTRAVAMAKPRSSWRPFLTVDGSGGRLRLSGIDGSRLECRNRSAA